MVKLIPFIFVLISSLSAIQVSTAQTKANLKVPYYEALGQPIGAGTYATVYNFAGKALKVSEIETTERPVFSTVKEGLVLSALSHPNIIKPTRTGFVWRSTTDPRKQKLFFEIEVPKYGACNDYVYPNPWDGPTFLVDVASALQYIHSRGLAHEDLKPQNILQVGSRYKLADFGGIETRARGRLSSIEKTTLWYRSFEKLLGNFQHPEAADIWALAIAYIHLRCKAAKLEGVPFTSQIDEAPVMYRSIRRALFPNFSEAEERALFRSGQPWLVAGSHVQSIQDFFGVHLTLSEQERDLLDKMLDLDPQERISASEILAHPFLADVKPLPHKDSSSWLGCLGSECFVGWSHSHYKKIEDSTLLSKPIAKLILNSSEDENEDEDVKEMKERIDVQRVEWVAEYAAELLKTKGISIQTALFYATVIRDESIELKTSYLEEMFRPRSIEQTLTTPPRIADVVASFPKIKLKFERNMEQEN